MLLIWALILIWTPSIMGWGAIMCGIRKKLSHEPEPTDLIFSVLIGLALLGTLANFLNIFMPITTIITMTVLLVGWLLFTSNFHAFRPFISTHFIMWAIFALLYISYMAYINPPGMDTGGYHIQTIKWFNVGKMPLGLANLHGRFGFNQIWFSVAAMLTLPMLQDHTYLLPNAILFWCYLLTAGIMIFPFRSPQKIADSFKLSDLFFLFSVSVCLILTADRHQTWSSPDLPIVLLTMLSIFSTLRGIESGQKIAHYIFLTFFIGIFAALIKFSAIPLLLNTILLIGWGIMSSARKILISRAKQLLKATLIIGIILVIPWMIKGMGVSGCLLYPIENSCIRGLSWTVPPELVKYEIDLITIGGRLSYIPTEPMGFVDWFPYWWIRFKAQTVVRKSSGLALLGISLIIWGVLKRKSIPFSIRLYFLPILTLFISLIFWFFSAPDPRFAAGYFWSYGFLLFAIGIYWNIKNARHAPKLLLAVVAITTMILWGNMLVFVGNHLMMTPVRFVEFPPLPPRIVAERLTNEGMTVFEGVRLEADEHCQDIFSPCLTRFHAECWDSPVPCTPYFNPDLIIRLDENGIPIYFSGPFYLAVEFVPTMFD